MEHLAALWTTKHRGLLHDVTSWSSSTLEISLTYVPTAAGFTGYSQLTQLSMQSPASRHLLNPSQLLRFNNRLEPVRTLVDRERRTVIDEFVLTALHCERADWLLPGVEATRQSFRTPFVVVARYAGEQELLESVHVYWEHATLLKQLGPKKMDYESLPILTGSQIGQRVVAPSTANANPLSSLRDGARVADQGGRPSMALTSSIGSVFADGPAAAQEASSSPAAPRPFQESHFRLSDGCEDESGSLLPAKPAVQTRNQAIGSSSIDLTDNPEPPIIGNPAMSKAPLRDHIFSSSPVHVRPSISLDPKRNMSQISFLPATPGAPAVRSTADKSRFESRIFSNDNDPAEPETGQTERQTRHGTRKDYESHVFDIDAGEAADQFEGGLRISEFANARRFGSSVFADENDVSSHVDDPHERKMTVDPTRFVSHISNYATTIDDSSQDQPRVTTKAHQDGDKDARCFSVYRGYEDYAEQSPPAIANSSYNRSDAHAYSANRSQIVFGDDQPAEPVCPRYARNARVTNPAL